MNPTKCEYGRDDGHGVGRPSFPFELSGPRTWSGLHRSNVFLVPQGNGEYVFISYILRFSHQILLCERAFRILLRPIREAKRVSYTWKIVSSNYKPRLKRIVFSRAFSWSSRVALSGGFDHWQDKIFGVLELFVILTYQELGDIFEDGWTIRKICVYRQTCRQGHRRPKKTRTLFQRHEEM